MANNDHSSSPPLHLDSNWALDFWTKTFPGDDEDYGNIFFGDAEDYAFMLHQRRQNLQEVGSPLSVSSSGTPPDLIFPLDGMDDPSVVATISSDGNDSLPDLEPLPPPPPHPREWVRSDYEQLE